ncbi:MAG: cytochrome c biogenesis protein [Bacteroidetes bacterium]|nr:cytochrome c biogenesis protein [Bacteroidota bacterium]
MNLKKDWYKWAAAILLLYVLLGGLALPLRPGIVGISPIRIETGKTVEVEVKVSNSQWTDPTQISAPYPKSLFFVSEKAGTLLVKQYQDSASVISTAKDSLNTMLAWVTDGVKYSLTSMYVKGTCNFRMGDNPIPNEMYSVFIQLSNGKYLGLPEAVFIYRGNSDTIGPENGLTSMKSSFNNNSPRFEMRFPNRTVLNESVRNLFYHVPMWFAMIALLSISVFYAVNYLRFQRLEDDAMADSLIKVALLAGILGCVTGAIWARVTWHSWWPREDPKLNGVAIGMMMYFAYLLLRSTLSDPYQRARITSVYSIFIFPIFIALILIMPKLSPNSLHPGAGGTVGFSKYDLDSTMRLFFYPAILGWIFLFYWISNLHLRITKLLEKE